MSYIVRVGVVVSMERGVVACVYLIFVPRTPPFVVLPSSCQVLVFREGRGDDSSDPVAKAILAHPSITTFSWPAHALVDSVGIEEARVRPVQPCAPALRSLSGGPHSLLAPATADAALSFAFSLPAPLLTSNPLPPKLPRSTSMSDYAVLLPPGRPGVW